MSDTVATPAVVILTGLSGGGKTAAAKLFEDLGYTVVDNLPGELLPDLAELVSSDRQRFARVAIVLDVRAGDATLALTAMRGALEGRGIRPRVIFLEASDDVLIRRFSETRHRHPLGDKHGIATSIAEERRILEHVRGDADIVLDTSDLSLRQLRERLFAQLTTDVRADQLSIQIISFGYKYGVPLEADLVFDVRFMQNPYYVAELRPISGLTSGPAALRATSGASSITRSSSMSITLSISEVAPARRIIALSAEPVDTRACSKPRASASSKPRARASIATNTATEPAMPATATSDERQRARRLSNE